MFLFSFFLSFFLSFCHVLSVFVCLFVRNSGPGAYPAPIDIDSLEWYRQMMTRKKLCHGQFMGQTTAFRSYQILCPGGPLGRLGPLHHRWLLTKDVIWPICFCIPWRMMMVWRSPLMFDLSRASRMHLRRVLSGYQNGGWFQNPIVIVCYCYCYCEHLNCKAGCYTPTLGQ